jgi:hypothetical protein
VVAKSMTVQMAGISRNYEPIWWWEMKCPFGFLLRLRQSLSHKCFVTATEETIAYLSNKDIRY